MNLQKVFDVVALHLLQQNKQCKTKPTACAYRNDAGLMCAFGKLIPDELYDLEMESNGLGCVINQYPQFKDHLYKEYSYQHTETEREFFYSVVQVHDLMHPSCWHDQLKALAERNNLEFENTVWYRLEGFKANDNT